MFAGLLNEPIEIYEMTKTKSQYGVISNTRTLLYTTRAKVGHIGGSRSVINQEITTPYTKNFVIRYYIPITDTCQILYKGKYYQVTSIDKDRDLQQQVIITTLVEE